MFLASRKIEIRDVEEPKVGGREVLVRVHACGICNTTDLHIFKGIRRWGSGYPSVWGHEVTGTIEKLGESVSGLRIGERVLVRMTVGGFAEYCTASVNNVVRLPSTIGYEEGVLGQLMPAVIRGVEKTVEKGDTVFIAGQGPAGLLFTQVAKALGASKVVVSDLFDERLKVARKLGADYLINAHRENVREKVAEQVGVVDVAVECVGIEEPFKDCEAVVKGGGVICVFGTHLKPVSLDLKGWEGRSLSLVIAREQPDETPALLRKTVRLLETGKVKVKPILSHVFSLEEAPKAFDLLENHPERVLKIALTPFQPIE